jgi:leucyl aminopeptidase
MTKIVLNSQKLKDQKTDQLVFLLEENFSFDKDLTDLSKTYFPYLKNEMEAAGFTGRAGQTFKIQGFDKKGTKHLFFAGLGKKKDAYFDIEDYRHIVAKAVRYAQCKKLSSLALHLPQKKMFGYDAQFMAQTTTVIIQLCDYKFDEFITDKNAKGFKVKEAVLVAPEKETTVVKKGIEIGTIVAEAVNRSRYWIDLPANKLSPKDFAMESKKLAKEHDLEITIFDEKKIEKLGMGGLKAVGMGSQHDSHLVIMHYTCKKKNAPTLALVGKGITFDSGGLNLKPTGYMETMKEDMSGAAAVVNALVALSQLKPNVNVVAVAALAENMVSGSANHPGDILTFYNGKTAVVGNTDAEGRLVLADALAYTSKHFKPTAMIDVATLTGAVAYAIGPFYTGVLTQDEKLAEKIAAAGVTAGEGTWRLPLTDRYKKMVSSDIADINNDGKSKYKAGSTNGACFLSHFVGDTPWVHLDIASTAFDVPDTPYFRPGSATGSGTRLLIDFVMQWK